MECGRSHSRLAETVCGLAEVKAAAPSRLPGWTVAQVLTHLVHHGDSVVRRLEAAARGVVVEQYPDELGGREAAIEAGKSADVDRLVADVRRSNAAVEDAFASLPAAAWERSVLAGGGRTVTAAHLAFARWREVEAHHVDLGLGYEPVQWPQPLVDRWLPQLLAGLSARSDQRALMAWALGRGPAPELQPWG